MYGVTFYSRHTAQHANKNTKECSFQSTEHIRKKVDGPYFEVSAKKASSAESLVC